MVVLVSHFMGLGPIPALFPLRLRALIQESIDTAPPWVMNEGRDKVLELALQAEEELQQLQEEAAEN